MAINMNRNNCWVDFCIRIRIRKCSIIMVAHKWRTFRNKSGKVRARHEQKWNDNEIIFNEAQNKIQSIRQWFFFAS